MITGQHYYDGGDLTTIAPRPQRMTGLAGPALPGSHERARQGQVIFRRGSRDVQVPRGDARHSLRMEL
eukprot:5561703-Pyramimonas_sp.AAC.1